MGCELMPISLAVIKDSNVDSLETKYHENDELHVFNMPLISVTSAGM